MKTVKYEDRFLLTWLVLSDSRFSEEAIFSAKASRSINCKSVSSFILQYYSDEKECGETNYNSNGVLLWISNIALSTPLVWCTGN